MIIYPGKPPETKSLLPKQTQKAGSEAPVREKDGAGKTQEVSTPDRVEISQRAKELKQIISELPDTRETRVQDLKQAVSEGTYEVDSLKVAQKMLDELL